MYCTSTHTLSPAGTGSRKRARTMLTSRASSLPRPWLPKSTSPAGTHVAPSAAAASLHVDVAWAYHARPMLTCGERLRPQRPALNSTATRRGSSTGWATAPRGCHHARAPPMPPSRRVWVLLSHLSQAITPVALPPPPMSIRMCAANSDPSVTAAPAV